MLSIGWTEMLIIAALALIVVGPRDLPAMLRQVGRAAGTVRRMGNDFRAELRKVAAIDDVQNIKKSVTEPFKQTSADLTKQFNTTTADGTVKPSGALAPADPNAQSVVNEIHAAAGIAPKPDSGEAARQSMASAVTKANKLAEEKAAADAAAMAEEADVPAKKPTRRRAATKKKVASTTTKTRRAPRKKATPQAVSSDDAPPKPARRRKPKVATVTVTETAAADTTAQSVAAKPVKPRRARAAKA